MTSPSLDDPRWRIGVELELMAPPGASRLTLAEALAARPGGGAQAHVRAFFHAQTEPSKVPGSPVFHSLTLGFEALDAEGELIARCVDDLTLQAELDRHRAARPDWCRVVSDDDRLLRILARHLEPADVIEPGARLREVAQQLLGTEPIEEAAGLVRLIDTRRAPIAIIARLPGERERPCEVVTPPIERDLGQRLESLIVIARELGFSVASEAATHLHFDAGRLTSASAVANLVGLVVRHRETLREVLGHNPRWQRTGAWPRALVERVLAPDYRRLDWPQARAALAELRPTKYCDFNLKNLAHEIREQHTVEARTIPGTLDTQRIVAAARLFEALLERATRPEPPESRPLPSSASGRCAALFDELALRNDARRALQPNTSRTARRR